MIFLQNGVKAASGEAECLMADGIAAAELVEGFSALTVGQAGGLEQSAGVAEEVAALVEQAMELFGADFGGVDSFGGLGDGEGGVVGRQS